MNNQHIQSSCREAEPYYYDYLQNHKEGLSETVIAHIDACPNCQSEIQWLKEAFAKSEESPLQDTQATLQTTQMHLHCALIDQPVRCSAVRPFLPILAMPEMEVRISTPVTEHIKACPECRQDLETLKQLDLTPEQLSTLSRIFTQSQSETSDKEKGTTAALPETLMSAQSEINSIINRPDSGIVTYFRANEDTAASSENVFTLEIKQDVTAAPAFHQQARQAKALGTAFSRSRRLLKPIAAAAVIAIIILFSFRGSPVNATDIGQIYEALKNVQNVILTHYDVDNPEPVQQVSISRSRGIKLLKTGSDFVLLDVKNRIKKSTDSDERLQQARLDRDTVRSITKTMNIPYGLLPFNSNADLPEGAVWKKVDPNGDVFNPDQTEIYDLFWTEKTSDPDVDVHYRWRCHLNPVTKHPFRLELWKQGPYEPEYTLITITEVTYPTENQMEEMINETGL